MQIDQCFSRLERWSVQPNTSKVTAQMIVWDDYWCRENRPLGFNKRFTAHFA
jgi:hypothetical protein